MQPVGQHPTSPPAPYLPHRHPTPPPHTPLPRGSPSLPIQYLPQLPGLLSQGRSPSSPILTGGGGGNGGNIPLTELRYTDIDSTVSTTTAITQSSLQDTKTGITFMAPQQMIPLQYPTSCSTATDDLLFWMDQTTASSSPTPSMSIDASLRLDGTADLSMHHYQQPAVSPVSLASDSPPMTPLGNRSPPLRGRNFLHFSILCACTVPWQPLFPRRLQSAYRMGISSSHNISGNTVLIKPCLGVACCINAVNDPFWEM